MSANVLQPYPSSSASTGRVLGEIRRFSTQYIESSFVSVGGGMYRPCSKLLGALTLVLGRFRRWLFPSKALFQYQAPHVVNGSGAWLFRHESYRSWLDSDKNELLWLTGKPGSGKSTLMKHLCHRIRYEDAIVLQEPAIAASIMFDFRYVLEREKGSAKGPLIRTLLYQMLESDPSLLSRLCQSSSPLSPFFERPEDMDVRHYQSCLEAALSAATDKATVFFLIDGLDECDSDLQDDLIACLAPICQGPRFNKKVRIMIASRLGLSTQRMQRQCQTSIRRLEMENSEDIATFCLAMLSPRRTSHGIIAGKDHTCVHWKDSIEQLVESIVSRANGVFLWVSLVVDLLLNDYPAQQHPDCGTKRWQKAVQELPVGLDLLFENLVDRIPTQSKAASDLLFMWCAYTVRPLEELEVHSLIRLNQEDLKLGSAWYEYPTIDLASKLRRLTYGLVEVVSDPKSNSSTVQFIHVTVRDFFTRESPHLVAPRTGSSQHPVGLAHTAMAKTCLRYIHRTFCKGKSLRDPFLKYSVLYWSFHAKAGERLAVSQDYLIELFQWPSTVIASLWLEEYERVHNRQIRSVSTSLLHVAAHCGLFSTVEALSIRQPTDSSWDHKDYRGRTPLHHAAAQGHTDIVRLLLDQGASVDVEDIQKVAPLQDASRKGHTSVVTALLAEGANAATKDATGRTAIHHAARAGDIKAVKMLVAGGTRLDGLDIHGHSVLTLAAASGNEELTEFLLRLNSTTWPATVVGVALAFAAALGFKTLTRSLLHSGGFSGPDDFFVQQAFIAAVVAGSEEALLLLLELGCHPDLHDSKYGQSALSIAAACGHDRLVRILLEHGAHANIQDVHTGITPVMHAISRGHPVIVQLLLDYGAEVSFPKEPQDHVDDGWIYKIILAFIHQCPSSDNGRSDNKKSANSSIEAVLGSPNESQNSQTSYNQGRKRCRSQKELDDSEDGSDDEQATSKKSRHDKESDTQFMCPFQKRFPDKHTCPPYTKVARLK